MDLYFNRGAGLFTRAEDLKKEADDMEGQNMGTLSIATMLRDREGKLADDTFYVHSLSGSFVATALIAYRMGRFDEAMQMVDTHGGAFPAPCPCGGHSRTCALGTSRRVPSQRSSIPSRRTDRTARAARWGRSHKQKRQLLHFCDLARTHPAHARGPAQDSAACQ